ncbi:alpha/beta-hydrolase [Mycena filopes]|nr:alpha/beta-hydrolase [Mycena filopes]
MSITPQDVANTDQISGLTLSATGDHVAYCVGPSFRGKDAHKTRALWLAETATPDSARQITAGLFNDHSPAFDPKSGDVFFLSDRHKAGGKAQIYRLSSAVFGGDPKPLTPTTNLRDVTAFQISPDGRWLAFTSADEPADKDEKDKETYVITWRAAEEAELCRLRVLDLTGKIEGYLPHCTSITDHRRIHTAVSVDSHVQSFVWSPDSTKILYRLAQLPDIESNAFPASEHILSLAVETAGDSESLRFASTDKVMTHTRVPFPTNVWAEPDRFHFLHSDNYTSSPALWVCDTVAGAEPTRLAYGASDDADAIAGVGGGEGEVAVGVACGLETRIDLVRPQEPPVTLFETAEEAFSTWAITRVGESYVFVAARSSGVSREAENVWCGVTTRGVKGVLSRKLSAHHSWVAEKEMPQCAPFSWTAEDGMELQGIVSYPRGSQPTRLPTVVVPHGGPYSRDTLHMRHTTNYRLLLASNGFLVLSPNYRGSQGRGTAFARTAHGGMGALDYADVESMLAAAVARGYADPDKVAIAGYSQGGFLAAWGCTRPDAPWKAGVIGAGPTDWGSLIVCSDVPDVEVRWITTSFSPNNSDLVALKAALGGTAPWTPRAPEYLKGSPIRDVRNVKAPLLLLHGEQDKRVPLTQAVGFMRGLKREAEKAVSDLATLVIYPREGHGFEERAHVEDQLTRVLGHVKKYLA